MTRRAQHRLVTLVFSHYNEKARWSLDYCGVEYRESAYLPGFSQLGVMMATRGRGGHADDVSSKWSTPLFLTKDGEELADSTDIAEWASRQVGAGGPGPLFPTPEVREVVVDLGKRLGPYTRRVAYARAFASKTALRTMARRNVGAGQAAAFAVLSPLAKGFISEKLGVNPEAEARAIDKVHAVIDEMNARLARSRFVVGDTFTAADITLACLLAPALLVQPEEGYGAVYPHRDELDANAHRIIDETRASPAGRFALDLFRTQRRARHDSTQK